MTDQVQFELEWLKANFTRGSSSDFAAIINEASRLFEQYGWERTQLTLVMRGSNRSYETCMAIFGSKRNLAVMVYRAPLDELITMARKRHRKGAGGDFSPGSFLQALAGLFTEYPVLAEALRPTGREAHDSNKDHPVLRELIRLLAVRLAASGMKHTATAVARQNVLMLLG